ncbi:hypothetical protein GCM10012280_33390 [Wenjunlia tyrosinilytica]|uniref:Phosphatase n=1 Tax=Wenjunlia tyrosinilytica TaxID=1544741 RepID=A0A917ZRB2_9ACTN|nr:hypothetical protein GCM10012280_33390 [Wenjunlia tyrosinilytica]
MREHLVATRIAGPVATTRERNLLSYRLFAAGDPRVLLGLDPERLWDVPGLLRLMADRCGVSPDPAHRHGPDTIDPERTLSALDAFADRLARAAADRVPVLFGTGHPERLLGFYAAVAAGLARAGCPVLTPARGLPLELPTGRGARPYVLEYVRSVALVRPDGAHGSGTSAPAHNHSPLPVRAALGAAAQAGDPLPRLVVGDHGWVCGAGQLGLAALGLADTNDPALFVGEAEGRVLLTVPLDDAVRSSYYRPLTRYVLNRACLSQ